MSSGSPPKISTIPSKTRRTPIKVIITEFNTIGFNYDLNAITVVPKYRYEIHATVDMENTVCGKEIGVNGGYAMPNKKVDCKACLKKLRG